MDERPASTSSYFARPPPPSRLLLRVYAAEGLQHVSSHGTYCKLYVGSTEMVRGSGAFARHTQKLTSSGSTHSLGGLLHSPFGNSSRGNTAQHPSTPLPPTSSSEGDLSGSGSKMRVLKTQVQKGKRPDPVWNEKFDIPVLDPNEDVLSIRVKSARLMSSPAIGACSIPLKYLMLQGATTVDRWIDLTRGKKDAGRIRLQLRLVDPSMTRLQSQRPEQDNDPASPRTTRQRNHQNSDTYLSLPAEESPEEIAARQLKKSSRRDHKYHRSARRFDGRPINSTLLGSSNGSNKSASDKDDDEKRTPTATHRNNSASATSNESIDDSEPASDVSISPAASPLPKRASNEDSSEFSDSESSTSAVTKPPRKSSNSLVKTTKSTPAVPAVAKGLDASYANRGTMRRSELERSRMKMAEITRTSRISRSSRSFRSSRASSNIFHEEDDDDDDDLDEYDNHNNETKRWTGNHTKLSVLSSTLDPRESSRMDFDDEETERDSLDNRKQSLNNGSKSIALSSTATSTLDPRDSSRYNFSDSDSDGEDDEDDEVKSEKAREQQRQQWQMEQRKMQLAGIKESSQSMSDDDSDEDSEVEDDEYDDEMERESTRMQFTPTLANLLCRESMNVLIEEEDDDDEEVEVPSYKLSEEFVPILEATSPLSVDSVDCALRRSSFD